MKAFASHGASTEILALLGTFLQNRSMSVRINKSFSPPLPVNGGCPQGSLLGVLIFNVSTDGVELPENSLLGELGGNEFSVGDLFDEADSQYLRENERRMLLLNEQALLIPGLHLPVLPSSIREESDFERNGSSSISLPARTDALTPMQITNPDLLVVSFEQVGQ